ncbi:MAG: hypothetical protein QXS19_07220 [Candidatus Methanomethylicia archaeon]
MTRIGLMIKNPKVRFSIINFLNEHDINFTEFSSIDELTNANVDVILTDEDNLLNLSFNLKHKIVFINDYYISQKFMFKIIPHIYDKDIFNEIIVGIDPGKTYGFILLADGKIILKREFKELNFLIELLWESINEIPAKNVLVRIGDGGGEFLKSLLDKLREKLCDDKTYNKSICLEIVNEKSLFGAVPKYVNKLLSNNVLSAYMIALNKGRRIKIDEYAYRR